jgi:hypothetical protein
MSLAVLAAIPALIIEGSKKAVKNVMILRSLRVAARRAETEKGAWGRMAFSGRARQRSDRALRPFVFNRDTPEVRTLEAMRTQALFEA